MPRVLRVVSLVGVGLCLAGAARAQDFPLTCTTTVAATQSAITNAINATSSGSSGAQKVICVQSGTATLSGNISITSKNYITVVGGTGNPTTTGCGTNGSCATETTLAGGWFKVEAADHIRIAGFKVDMSSSGSFPLWGDAGATTNYRVDHMNIVGQSTGQFTCWMIIGDAAQPSYGVFDHNNVLDCQREITMDGSNITAQNKRWFEANPIGSDKASYFEDEYIAKANPTADSFFNCWDAHNGGSYVVRFSKLHGCRFEAHSVQSANERSTRSYEFYYDAIEGPDNYRPYLLRGGSGPVWHNTISNTGGSWTSKSIHFDNQRDYTTDGTLNSQLGAWGHCDGTSTVDENTTSREGFKCLDQIGTITDASNWGGSYTTPRNIAQSVWGLLMWKNTDLDTSNEQTISRNCASCTGTDQTRSFTQHLVENEVWWQYNSGCTGGSCTSGIGEGASLPTGCTTGMFYFKTNDGSWNTSASNPSGVQANGADGILYRCVSTNTWASFYTPYTYPHPLQGVSASSGPSRFRLRRVHGALFIAIPPGLWALLRRKRTE